MEKTVVDVVAAIIWDGTSFLICQRPANKKRALLWEFPGGKVEDGETPEQALEREIREELAMDIRVLDEVAQALHEYPDMTVRLHLFNAVIRSGKPHQLEHNDMRWIDSEQVSAFTFCPADEEILDRIAQGKIQAPDTRCVQPS